MPPSPPDVPAIRWLRRGVFAFFVVYLLAVTWPGAVPFSSATPLVLGLPFSLAWPILWIVLGGLALWVLDHFETRGRRQGGGRGEGSGGSG